MKTFCFFQIEVFPQCSSMLFNNELCQVSSALDSGLGHSVCLISHSVGAKSRGIWRGDRHRVLGSTSSSKNIILNMLLNCTKPFLFNDKIDMMRKATSGAHKVTGIPLVRSVINIRMRVMMVTQQNPQNSTFFC